MTSASTEPESFLPLTPAAFHVLLALTDGDRHGYAIMQFVRESPEIRSLMGPGTLYGTLKRLLDSGLVEESESRPDPDLDDERRRYYRLSPLGKQVVAAECRRHAALVHMARSKGLLPTPATNA